MEHRKPMAPAVTSRRRPRRRTVAIALVLVILLAAVAVSTAIATDTLGAGNLWERAVAKVDRFLAGPVPDRPAPGTILVADPGESEEPEPDDPDASYDPGVEPSLVPLPTGPVDPGVVPATPKPAQPRKPVDVDIVKNHDAVFAHELNKSWCSPAGVQMVLAILGHANTSNAFQRELQDRVHEWESVKDSRNGLWGPSAMSLALDAYGVKGYEVRAYQTRQGALRDGARAIKATRSPVILLAWRGAHTWVMTGYRADADPTVFSDARIDGAYILDPWYPDISSIWGPSDPPGTFQNDAEMVRNYLKWKRPEGSYPQRDGLYISVVPTIKAS